MDGAANAAENVALYFAKHRPGLHVHCAENMAPIAVARSGSRFARPQ